MIRERGRRPGDAARVSLDGSLKEETIMRGRYPSGPEVVDHLEGSTKAKERLRVILETMTGDVRVSEACARLDICEQRFRQLRAELLQAALASLEDRPAGRPRRLEEPEEMAVLRQQLEALQRQQQTSQVREEISLALPQVRQAPAAPAQEKAPQKKRRSKP
jgi:transposase-like protein